MHCGGAPSPVAEIYLVHSLTGWAGRGGLGCGLGLRCGENSSQSHNLPMLAIWWQMICTISGGTPCPCNPFSIGLPSAYKWPFLDAGYHTIPYHT